MDIKRQERAPIYEALEEFKKKRVVPFDVPGHKRGRGNPELVEAFISNLEGKGDLEKAAATIAQGIKDYSTDKRGR